MGGDFSVNTSGRRRGRSKIEKPEERGTERRENYRIDIKL